MRVCKGELDCRHHPKDHLPPNRPRRDLPELLKLLVPPPALRLAGLLLVALPLLCLLPLDRLPGHLHADHHQRVQGFSFSTNSKEADTLHL